MKNKTAHKRKLKAAKAKKSTITGVLVSIILAIVKGVAGILGNSYALIADAIESVTDVFSSLILWTGIHIASKDPDEDHPYGHGKAEPIAAIIVTIFLVGAALLIAVQSIRNLFTPHEIPASYTLIVLALVVIVKEIIFRYVVKIGKSIDSKAVEADAWHHRSDALTSLAAFVGISIALIGGKGYEYADDWAALLSSGVILVNAYLIFKPSLEELMDKAPDMAIVEKIKESALKIDQVKLIEKCHVRKMGFEYYVDMHVQVEPNMTVFDAHTLAHHVKEMIMHDIDGIGDVLIHIEPFTR